MRTLLALVMLAILALSCSQGGDTTIYATQTGGGAGGSTTSAPSGTGTGTVTEQGDHHHGD